MNQSEHSGNRLLPGHGAIRTILFAAAFFALPRPSEAQHGGIWEPPFDWPMVPIHMLHHTNGDILSWAHDGLTAHVWHTAPSTTFPSEFTAVPNPYANHFCAGHAGMTNGLYLIAGGYFIDSVQIFDNLSSEPGVWIPRQDMNYTRFYPTCTTLPDGRILTVSGDDGFSGAVETPEVYDPSSNTWTPLDGATQQLPLYPHMFLLPNGRVFQAGPGTTTRALNVESQTWTFVATSTFEGGSAVMYLPGKVMKCGGLFTADKGTEVIDFTQNVVPAWQTVGSMNYPRATHNLTLLPDGTVLVTGGWDELNQPVLAAEVFDPRSGEWKLLSSAEEPRLYHSTAQLLRDARVVSGGGEGYPSAEIFRPPYLFSGPRPGIVSAPTQIEYQQEFTVWVTYETTSVASVALVRLGAVTHAFDQNQRYVPLKFEPRLHVDPPSVHMAAPRDARLAPPGAYMLFIVSGAGVPSVGHYIYLK